MRRWAVILALATACASNIRAEELPITPLNVADEGAPIFTVYSTREGLSDEIWSTVGFDSRGFVWAGSASTLARFDGYRWTSWPFPEARSLVRDMQADSSGILWAIFEREGLARYDGRLWSLYPAKGEFHQRFSDIHRADGSSELWVGQDRGFWRLSGERWLPDAGNHSVQLGPTTRIERTETLFGAPREWMATTSDGVWYRTVADAQSPGPWQRFDMPEFRSMRTTDMRRTVNRGEEELWVVSYGNGLGRIRNDGIRIWRAANGELPTEALYSALATYAADGQQTLWIASRAGLLRVTDDKIVAFDRRNGLPSDAVRGIKLQRSSDGADLLWLATEGGIARAALTASPWQTVSLLGSRENGTSAILLEPDGLGGERLWIGTAKQGLGLFQAGEWRYFSFANGKLPGEGVRLIVRLAGPDGKPWRLVSLLGGQLLRVDDRFNFTPLQVPWPAHAEEAVTSALSRELPDAHELWFSTYRSGIHRLKDGLWTPFLAEGAKQPWAVLALAEQVDAGGRSWLWAASSQGLARYDGEHWTLLPASLGLPVDGYRGVSLIADGAQTILWASSNRSGVVRVDVSDPMNPTLRMDSDVPAAPDPTVYSILPDSQGRIYVCTNNGVQLLTPTPKHGYSERVFRRRDGLVHDECNTNSQFVDAQDRYWVGTLGGLSLYDPSLQTALIPTQPKALRFTALVVDGERRDTDAAAQLTLPAGSRELHVDYTLLSGLRENESTYRSQLLGYESDPGAWTTEHALSFSGLAPGAYELIVEARDYAGTASTPLSLEFSVQAHWWQRSLNRVLLGLLTIAVGIGIALLYNRGLRERQRLLKREVAKHTTEIRAANQRLTELSYQDPLTGVANRRRLMEAIDIAIERAAAKSLPIGLIVIDVDHFKKYNDQHGHLAGDVALRAVALALQSATREQDLVARFGGEEFACLMIDAEIDVVVRCAERMRALVEALPPRTLGNSTQTITISAGVMSRVPSPGDHGADLLRDTDMALYRAKHEGRNLVRRAGPATTPSIDS